MSVNLDADLAVHVQAINARGLRTKLLASNIANVDTPNYKATDLQFGDTLAAVSGGAHTDRAATTERPALAMASPTGGTHPAHLRLNALTGRDTDTAPGKVMYRYPDAPSLDGNTVDKDTEQARFAENAVRYRASLQFLGNRVGSLIRALKGE